MHGGWRRHRDPACANINLKKPFGILVRLRKPLDYDAIDGEPVDIVFLLLIPANSGDQLNALRRSRENYAIEVRLIASATHQTVTPYTMHSSIRGIDRAEPLCFMRDGEVYRFHRVRGSRA